MDDFESMQIDDRKIIVAYDFGTTYSGAACAVTKRPDHRTHVNQWPIDEVNYKGRSSDKVPTILHYSENNMLWGFQVNVNIPVKQRVEWFKLGLNPDSGKDLWQNPTDYKVDVLITDYLSALNKHVMVILAEKLGASVLRATPIEFVLAVPAIWTELAKQKTLDACEKAGLTTEKPISLVSEPEAAAIYTLHGLDPHGLQEGETFVICGAGGGTVDLVSYTITRLRPILGVEEAAPGSGGTCGSTFLDISFASFLKKKLGLEGGWDDEILEDATERFDSVIKKELSINDDASKVYCVPVPGMADNPVLNIRRGKFALQNKDLRAIFDPIVNEIIQLVKDQIQTTKTEIKAVLLVAIGKEIEVMQPPNAWLAVVNGAVMKGLAQAGDGLSMVSIVSRKARKHYGIELSHQYVDALHSSIQHKRYWDEKDALFRVWAMSWFIKKGDKVSENEPYLIPFVSSKLVNTDQIESVGMTVFCDQASSSAPLQRTGTVTKLVNVTADLSNIPTSALDQVIGKDGRTYYEVHCDIEAVYLSASTTYTLIHKGVRYDSVTAEYV